MMETIVITTITGKEYTLQTSKYPIEVLEMIQRAGYHRTKDDSIIPYHAIVKIKIRN